MIAIVDYGVGNLRSVQKAFEYLGYEAVVTSDAKEVLNSEGIILPGVGAFPDAMENLRARGLDEVLKKASEINTPILGICLGMQLLFDIGHEIKECAGLGLIKGNIKRLEGKVKIPHMGWNDLKIDRECPLLEGVEEGSYVYFVHSFYADVENNESLNASTFYGQKVPAIVSNENVFGIQFHPEKSGNTGLRILRNFGELIKK